MPNDVAPSNPNWKPPAFPEPAPSDVIGEVPASWLAMDPEGTPLDTQPYQPELTPLDIPPYVEPKDKTPKIHIPSGPGGGPRDQLTELTLGQEVDLLAKNNVFMSKRQLSDSNGLGSMKAYVVGSSSLSPAREIAVRVKKVRLEHPPTARQAEATYSYSAFESHLQKQLVSDNKIGGGVPKLFKVDASYTYASATGAHETNSSIHFEITDWIAKAHIVISPEDIVLDDKFVQKIRNACQSSKKAEKKAEELLSHLEAYGHFVPLSITVGGRMTLSEDTKIEDWQTFDAVKNQFKAAADARFKVKNVPVQVGGGAGAYIWTTNETKVQEQAKNLKMELKGGNESLADNNPVTLGDSWIGSLGSYKEWRTFGFGESSLVPIINLLPKDLYEQCKELLKRYFVHNLITKDTGFAGHESEPKHAFLETNLKFVNGGNPPFTREGSLGSGTRGLRKIVVTAQGHVDGLKLEYEIYRVGAKDWYAPTMNAAGRYGRDRTSYEWPAITFEPDEFISALEVWVDEKKDKGTMRAMAIRTTKGKRWPNDSGFYGTNFVRKENKFHVIMAPRVRALRGFIGDFIHAIGLGYLDIKPIPSRNYLIAMEPDLFPTGNFGALGAMGFTAP
jgi:hypothetical protein